MVSKTKSTSVLCAVSGVELFGKILLSPGRKPGRFPTCYFVCEDDLIGRIRTQIGMRFEVPEHRGDLRSSREESREDVGRDLREGEVVTLSIKHVDDLIKAHELTDERQILTMTCLIRVCEGAGHDMAEFVDVAHVNATHTGIKRKRPAHGSVCLLLRS